MSGQNRNKMATAIVALTKENGMGMNGKIPWKVPEDFKYFKNFTMGKICVMGRKTYEDILTYSKNKNDPLPGRQLIVISSKPHLIENPPNILSVEKIEHLVELNNIPSINNLCFIGGSSLYAEAAKLFSIHLSVTRLSFDHVVQCDTFFNPLDHGFSLKNTKPLDNTKHYIETYYNSWWFQ